MKTILILLTMISFAFGQGTIDTDIGIGRASPDVFVFENNGIITYIYAKETPIAGTTSITIGGKVVYKCQVIESVDGEFYTFYQQEDGSWIRDKSKTTKEPKLVFGGLIDGYFKEDGVIWYCWMEDNKMYKSSPKGVFVKQTDGSWIKE